MRSDSRSRKTGVWLCESMDSAYNEIHLYDGNEDAGIGNRIVMR
jgi:hypothetical protein